MPRSRVKVSAVRDQDRDQIDFDNRAQAVFEWSEAVAETYGRLDKSNLPSWLARVLAAPAPHLEQCRVCQDRILRIVMLLEDIEASDDAAPCDALEYHRMEYAHDY